jgi:hypothetical protein
MLVKEIIAFYSENCMKSITKNCNNCWLLKHVGHIVTAGLERRVLPDRVHISYPVCNTGYGYVMWRIRPARLQLCSVNSSPIYRDRREITALNFTVSSRPYVCLLCTTLSWKPQASAGSDILPICVCLRWSEILNPQDRSEQKFKKRVQFRASTLIRVSCFLLKYAEFYNKYNPVVLQFSVKISVAEFEVMALKVNYSVCCKATV